MNRSSILTAFAFVLLTTLTGRPLVHAQGTPEAPTPGPGAEGAGVADSDPDAGDEATAAEAEGAEGAEGVEGDAPTEGQTDRQQAGERFRRGVAFYTDGDYRAALIEFRRAYEIAPNYRVLFNLGQASFQLHDYAEAKISFEEYLREGGDEITEDRRTEVELELTTLSQYISTLDIQVSVEGAEISIDGQVVGVSPLGRPAVLSVGRREVIVTLEGYGPVTRVVDLGAGDEVTLELELLSLTETSTKLSTGFWIASIATGAVAIATITTGVLAFQANSELEDQLNTFPNSPENIASARERVQNLSLATDILIAGVGVGIIATVLIGIFARSTTEADEENPDPEAIAIRPTANGVLIAF